MSDIKAALTRLFAHHRIVVWTDEKRELRGEFDALAIDGVTKIVLANDEFGVKHRVLPRAESDLDRAECAMAGNSILRFPDGTAAYFN